MKRIVLNSIDGELLRPPTLPTSATTHGRTARSHVGTVLPAILLASLFATPVHSAGLHLRVVDAGPGLCAVAVIPGDHYFVYDTGHWDWDEVCFDAVRELVPAGATIDLIVLSHRDSDHIAATDEILGAYQVDTLVRTGNKATFASGPWKDANKAIGRAKAAGKLKNEVNLYSKANHRVDPGWSMPLGTAKAAFVIGYHKPPPEWNSPKLDRGWEANAGSIVVRLEYAGKHVLLTGDSVGRRKGSSDSKECLATEQAMVQNAGTVPIKANVLVAPHHGANNASSRCLIDAVKPDWVIFSAGHDNQHPTEAAAQRYLDAGIPAAHILRTDKGDYESGNYHWQAGTTGGPDLPRDDDVEVFIEPNGTVCVEYRGSGIC